MNQGTSFGSFVRQRRREMDLTQEELAQRVDCAAITSHKIYLSSWEKCQKRRKNQLIVSWSKCYAPRVLSPSGSQKFGPATQFE